jgi:hypothetical protein
MKGKKDGPNTISVPIDGKLVKLKVQRMSIGNLVPDENNPRMGFYKDAQPKESLSDEEIRFVLTSKSPEAYGKLRDSVHNNKGIINPIWIEPIGHDEYRVIEGNSRLLIYQDLNKLEPNEDQWKTIICYVLPIGINEDEKSFIRLLAHLRGTNEWDAYEKAKYLFKLSNDNHWPTSKIEKQTKLVKREIEQNIEAFKTMLGQYLPTHTEPFEVTKFSYFVEYVKDNKLRRAMDKNGFTMADFCEWVGDSNKIPTGQDVRKLRDILEDKDATELFKSKGFEASMEILAYRKPDITNPFYRDIDRVVERLKAMPAFEIEEVASETAGGSRKRMIADLAKWSSKILQMINEN